MNGTAFAVSAILLLTSLTATQAADPAPPPGAVACSGCHASESRSGDAIPQIRGLDPDDVVAAMQAFRKGERSPTVMDRIAKGFSDEEVRAIAVWLEKQPEGKRP